MYKGYIDIELNNEEMAEFYQNDVGLDGLMMEENEYCIIHDEAGNIVDKYCYQNGKLRPLVSQKRFSNSYMGTVKPKNDEQEMAFDMFIDRESKVKVLRGVYGSGSLFARF